VGKEGMTEGKIRVLIVDDSSVVRKVLAEILSADAALEVVGAAANGKLALDAVARLNPDVVTLDVEMPEMDGIETVKRLRKTHNRLPIIMFSSFTDRGSLATVRALANGANDYVFKPSNSAQSRDVIRDQLLRKIKLLVNRGCEDDVTATRVKKSSGPNEVPIQRIDVVAIGTSTGGPSALAQVIPRLPKSFAAPILIVQHMPKMFTRLLAERLHERSPLEVVEAQNGEEVYAGKVYIAPGDYHMEVRRVDGKVTTHLQQGPPEHSCRPAMDVLLRSVVDVYGSYALGVILTGMGQDGFKGCELLRQAGGIVLAQDQESSVVWGMPGYVAQAGLAEAVVPINGVAGEIIKRVRVPLGASPGEVS
jgi:two-component system chemotaxis response regulator CheB